MNLRRMGFVIGGLAISMAVACGLCVAVMPEEPPIPRTRPAAQAAFPPGMADLRPWSCIVIHQVISPDGPAERRAQSADRGIAYHFVIGDGSAGLADGQIATTQRWVAQTSSIEPPADSPIGTGINIAVVGDFSESYPSPAQLNNLVELVYTLTMRFRIPADSVVLHRELAAARAGSPAVHYAKCPGEVFPADGFFRLLADHYRPGASN